MTEHDERLPVGPPGPAGPRGLRGLSNAATYAIVSIFIAAFVVAAGGLWVGIHGEQQATRSGQKAAAALAAINHHDALCTALMQLSADKPPAGNPETNPSRAYLQSQYETFNQLLANFGCTVKGKP